MERPKVGVGVIVVHGGKVLMGKRVGAHGAHTWGFPGGHLEFGESVEECAARETMEEAGLKLKNIQLVHFTNDVFHEKNKHYITLYALAEPEHPNAQVMEPHAMERWEWVDWNKMPEPVFLPILNLKKLGYHPFD